MTGTPGEIPRPGDEQPASEGPDLLRGALRSAGSDAAKYLPVRLVPALTSLITVPVFTAAIGAADYGAFYLVSSVATLAANLSTGWISDSLIRFYWPMRKEGRLDRYIATIVWGSVAAILATAGIAYSATALGIGALPGVIARLVPAGIMFFMFNTLTNILVQIPRAANRAGAYARLQVSGVVATTAIAVALVWWGRMGAAGILWGVAAGWAILVPFMLRDVAGEGSLSPAGIDGPTVREFLSYGLPLVPVSAAAWALSLIDRFVVGAFRGTLEVGLYSVSYSLGDRLMGLVTLPLLLTMTPSLINAFERRGQHLAENVQTHFVRYFALATVPVLVGMWAASRPFLEVFTAKQYWVASPVLAIVAGGTILSAFAQVAGTGLALHKRTRTIMENTLAAAAFKLVSSMLLVPRWGYIAAAYSTLASYGVLLGLTWWRSRRYMKLTLPWPALARIAAAGIGAGAVLVVAFGNATPSGRLSTLGLLAGEAAVLLAVYSALCTLFGAVRRDEWAFIGEVAARGIGRLRRGGRPRV